MLIGTNNIKAMIEHGDWEAMAKCFDGMSNMEFRQAQTFVRQQVLSSLPNGLFWSALFHLVKYKRQAFLSGITEIKHLACNDELQFHVSGAYELREYIKKTSPDSVHKLVRMALPELSTESQIHDLFYFFGIEDERDQIAALIRVSTPITYYVLFLTLKRIGDNHELAHKCCVFILKKDDEISFNMASILKAYFGLEKIKSQLSLRISPYELSYIDLSYEKFKHVLLGKKPKIL